ncbi:hypothetical protein [uncultured Azohydromonas sp.]|uniref:hypothetical protein n=1 Tax=uncultured Azohydromonas sp. TaxID=487342 RepID=UPI002629AA3C|nr:hypothetical protein [uncultured Azohydromonas sp.]
MSEFLVIAGRCAADRGTLARAGIVLDNLDRQVCATASAPGSAAFAVARMNGTGALIARDEACGDWLIASGTWFHSSGLCSGDEQALLARVRSDGAARVARELEGFFAILHGDAATGSVTVIGDVAGSCHCYVRDIEGGVAISTSAACLAALGPASLDPVATAEFLATGIIFEDRSLWSEVRKFAPACLSTYAGGRWSEQPAYWSIRDITPERYGLAEAADAIGAAMAGAARRIAGRFPRVLCDVTGGYDSRATIAGFLASGLPIGATVSGAADSGDVLISKAIAARFGLPHRHAGPGGVPSAAAIGAAFRCSDGQYDLIEYAQIASTHAAQSRDNDIGISGSYGELARAYWWELLFPSIGKREPVDADRIAAARIGAAAWDAGLIAGAARVELVPHLAEVIRRANRGLEDRPNTTQMDNVYFSLRMQRWHGRIASSTDHIWPCLSPYMLKSVLVPVLETRAQARMRSLVVREMLERQVPALAAIPMEHGYPALRARLTNLHRFWPVVPHYAGRVAHKLARLAGVGQRAGAVRQEPMAVLLGRDEALRAQLAFPAFRGSGIADEGGLDRFLSNASGAAFGFNGQFCRLFSIEVALEAVARARAKAAPGGSPAAVPRAASVGSSQAV